MLVGLLDLDGARRVVLDRLVDELVPVREDEDAAGRAVDPGEGDRLAEPRRHLDEVGSRRVRVDDVDALLLIVAKRVRARCGHVPFNRAVGNAAAPDFVRHLILPCC